MARMQIHNLADEVVLSPLPGYTAYPITDSEGPTNVGPFDQIIFLVDADVDGQGGLVFIAQVSYDGVNWFDAYIHNLMAAANKWVLAANVTIGADVTAALFELSIPAPYVRVGVQNLDQSDATFTIWAIVNCD